MHQKKQPLGLGKNPVKYHEVIDNPASLNYQIREQVIFPTLFPLLTKYLGEHEAPIVDVGSGTGSLTARLTRTFPGRVSGFDVSEQFLAFAKSHYPDIPFDTMRHPLGGGFNAQHVHSHLVLHCVDEVEAHVEQLIDVTEPNGYLFITIPHPDHFKERLIHKNRTQESLIAHVGEAQMLYFRRTLQWYEQMFRRLGVHVIEKQECFARSTETDALQKYVHDPHFIVYVLQKPNTIVDTALMTHRDTGKVLLLTRSKHLKRFPGAKSLLSEMRHEQVVDGHHSIAQGIKYRIGITVDYVSPYQIGSMQVKHKHASYTQHGQVNLYAAQFSGPLPDLKRGNYSDAVLIPPRRLKPFGGACTQMAYNFLQDRA